MSQKLAATADTPLAATSPQLAASRAPSPRRVKICEACRVEYEASELRCVRCGAWLSRDLLAYPPGVVLRGKYEIVDLLGYGAMGTVYRARHLVLGREVALKLIHPHLLHEAEQVARFRREAIAASSIDHPSVLRVIDIDEVAAGEPFLVTELLEGRDLDRCLAEGQRFPVARIVEIIAQVLEGLEAAHKKGVIHRDLKPQNLFIVPQPDGGERVKIVDFGLAKLLEKEREAQSLTAKGFAPGTPPYMAPEQFRGEAPERRTNLWAVGVVLYQLLTGELPFGGVGAIEIGRTVLSEEPVAPRRRAPKREIPLPIERLCLAALSKDPAGRPAGATAMREQLLAVGRPARRWRAAATIVVAAAAGVATAFLAAQGLRPGQAALAAQVPGPALVKPAPSAAPAPSPERSPDELGAEAALERGRKLLYEGDYEQAARFLERALKNRPQDPMVHRLLGDTYFALGKKKAAVAQWKAFVRLAPDAPDARGLVDAGGD